jgi:hypothetical protein
VSRRAATQREDLPRFKPKPASAARSGFFRGMGAPHAQAEQRMAFSV